MSNNHFQQPFTAQEKELLVTLVQSHKDVIESKKSDNSMSNLKRGAWDRITDEFNSNSFVTQRTQKALRKCLENMKARAKLKAKRKALKEWAILEKHDLLGNAYPFAGEFSRQFAQNSSIKDESEDVTLSQSTNDSMNTSLNTTGLLPLEEESMQGTNPYVITPDTAATMVTSQTAASIPIFPLNTSRGIPLNTATMLTSQAAASIPIFPLNTSGAIPINTATMLTSQAAASIPIFPLNTTSAGFPMNSSSSTHGSDKEQSMQNDESLVSNDLERAQVRLVRSKRKYIRMKRRQKKKEHELKMAKMESERLYWVSLIEKSIKDNSTELPRNGEQDNEISVVND